MKAQTTDTPTTPTAGAITPLPWKVVPFLTPHEDADPLGVYKLECDIQKRFDSIEPPDATQEDADREEKELDAIHAENAANAAYIVKCANSHQQLVEALRDVMRHCVTTQGMPDKGKGRTAEQDAAYQNARALLASLA